MDCRMSAAIIPTGLWDLMARSSIEYDRQTEQNGPLSQSVERLTLDAERRI